MKIAVVGCGAVGSFYGAKLTRSGHDVHFLLRSDYDVVRRRGVRVRSPEGDFQVFPKAALVPEDIGESELVLIGLKTTANDQCSHLLPPLAGKETTVLTLQNGLGNEECLARLFPEETIMGGLCFVCLNRLEPGLVHHLAHGQIVIGEYQRPPQPRTHDIAEMFRRAGVPCVVADNLAQSHWEKLVWNIPFNGLGVAGVAGYESVLNGLIDTAAVPQGAAAIKCLSTDALLADARWTDLVRELMLEVIAAARGLGFGLTESLADRQIERTRAMGPYRASTLIDFEKGQPLELESLFLEPLRQANAAAAQVPRLASLCRILQQLDRIRAGACWPATPLGSSLSAFSDSDTSARPQIRVVDNH